MDPDRLAELEEERRFLLRSIDDLDREHDAGDVDDGDYATLRDGYVARAAAVLRAIDEGRAALPAPRAHRWSRLVAGAAITAAVALGLGWWVSHSSGQRLPGQTVSGGAPVDEVTAKLTQARQLLGTDVSGAIKLYQDVRTLAPDNVEARTYIAWLLVVSSRGASADVADVALQQGRVALQAVTTSDADYPDAWCFLAIVDGRFQQPADTAAARAEAQACLDHNPPAAMRGLIQSFLDDLDAANSSVVASTSP